MNLYPPTTIESTLGDKTLHELIRYFLASVAALAVDFSILTLLTSFAGVHYLLSGGAAFTLGLLVIYVLSVHWVFDARPTSSWLREFFIFAAIGVVGLAINELVLWIFTSVLGFFYVYSKIFSIVLVFSWNFGARKTILFSDYDA